MSMTTQEIMEILPHRHPFLLIDTVEEVEPGVRADRCGCDSFAAGMERKDGIFCRNQ